LATVTKTVTVRQTVAALAGTGRPVDKCALTPFPASTQGSKRTRDSDEGRGRSGAAAKGVLAARCWERVEGVGASSSMPDNETNLVSAAVASFPSSQVISPLT